MAKHRSAEIRDEILRHVFYNFGRIDAENIAGKFSISPQAVYKHIKYLVDSKKIIRERIGRGFIYILSAVQKYEKNYMLEGLKEDIVLTQDFKPLVSPYLSENAYRNYAYVFTEMLNNAIEHSEGTTVSVVCFITDFSVETIITDDGVGIFSKIQKTMGLIDKKHAFLELAKGKYTSDPKSHSGEGIFFSSKISDKYLVLSDSLMFSTNENAGNQYIYDFGLSSKGTNICFLIARNTPIVAKDVFDEYTGAPDSYGFNKTVIPVYLLEYEENNPTYVSRSQAKRLLVRFEDFATVILDFVNVPSIGQGFADEIFRVFANKHPECKISYINASKDVEAMIRHVMR